MKRLLCCVLILITAVMTASCAGSENTSASPLSSGEYESSASGGEYELRGVWISYGEMGSAFDGDFFKNIDIMLDNVCSLGFNTVFVHVRPFCDAFYESELFPWSAYITGTQGKSPGFDPLEYIVSAAHQRRISVHAWINPYRVSYKTENPSSLADSSPVRRYMEANPDSTFAVGCNGGLYLNPANSDAEKLIVDGVKEILDGYDVDGIHFDDYFYPTTDESFDKADYTAYAAADSDAISLGEWRRENVNRMLKGVYDAVKSYDSGIQFGVSPAGNNELNYNELYADTAAWAEGGYVDYLIPQLYFGYEYSEERLQYDNLVYEWSKLKDKVTLYAGLGAYKIGAGYDSEKAEWSSGNLLEKMINYSRGYKYKGFVIFSYSSLFSGEELNTNERNRISELIGE